MATYHPRTIAVAGKGGTGKTTLAALIVQYLRDKAVGPVLAVDADPDANLGGLLGIPARKTVGDLRDEVLKEIASFPAGMTKASYVEAGLHQIVEEAKGFDLISMGKGEGPGCYCYLNSLIRKFSDDLMPSYAWVVLDNEAGLEHISRRTTANIDVLLVVVNNSPVSFDTAVKINDITRDLKNGIRHKYLVANAVDERWRGELLRRVAQTGLELIGEIPRDPVIAEMCWRGEPLMQLEKSLARDSVATIMERIGGGHGDS